MTLKRNIFFIILIILINYISTIKDYSKESAFEIPSTICFKNKSKIITTLNNDPSLIINLPFDEIKPIDLSDYSNHPTGEVGVGPSSKIKGNSAFFDGNQMLTIKHSRSMEIKRDISVTLWIYLLEDSTGNWRTIFSKGGNIQEMTPTIMLWPNERRLHVRVGSDASWNDGLESKGLLNLKQWTHIAMVISGQLMQLYINGNLDNQIILKGKVKMNKGDFHIGKDLFHSGTKCYIDDFKVFTKALDNKYIQAEAAIGAPLLGNEYVKLGCEECTFVEALTKCEEEYHMCSYEELYSGAFLVARRNGWFQYNSEIWIRQSEAELEKSAYLNEVGDPSILKMSLCCSNN